MSSSKRKEQESVLLKKSEIYWPWELRQGMFKAPRPAVMFDVIAASYNIIYLSKQANELYVTTKEAVEDTLAKVPDALLIGEIDEPALYEKLKNKFVATNSPRAIAKVDVTERKVILISNNGTHTLSELLKFGAGPVFVGHYANITALTTILNQQTSQEPILLVPSGGREINFKKDPNLYEDLACARTVQKLLLGNSVNFNADFSAIRRRISAQYGSSPPSPETINLLMQADIFLVVPRCHRTGDNLIRVTVS